MSVTLSIKQVPDDVAERLRRRAARNHRSMQRELLALVEAAVREPGVDAVPQAARQVAREPAADYAVPRDPRPADDLLAELDGIVAGSRFGHAPLLTREQANDRMLAREIDFDARTTEARPRQQP